MSKNFFDKISDKKRRKYIITNQNIVIILIISFFLTPFVFMYSQTKKQKCIVETREYPGKDKWMWDGIYAASDGKVYTGLITEGASSHFYMYSPKKDVNILLYDISEFLGERGKGIRSSGKLHNKPVEDNNGNIYFVSMNNGSGPRNFDYTSWKGGHWLRYSPSENKLTDLGLVDDGIGCYPLTIDKKRNFLFGIGFTGYFYRFDINKRETKNLGRVSNWDICRNIFCDDKGDVYASFPVARVCKYDAVKEKVYNLSIKMPYDPSIFPTQLVNPMVDRTMDWRAVTWDSTDKVAYGITGGSGSILFKYNPHSGSEGKFTTLAKMCDSKFLKSNRKDIPYSTLAFTLDSKNKKIFFVPSAREYKTEKYVETFGNKEAAHLLMFDIRKGTRADLGAMQTPDGRRIFGCEGASVAPDGTVYICGQAEVKNKEDATSYIGDIPTALHLIIYKQK